jgi:acid phosphatase family membrane protein YuiD
MLPYPVAPLFGWFVAGSLKFVINSIRGRGLAFRHVGYGGMPSTHTSIVTTTAVLIGLREGWNTPAFAAAAALMFVVMLDAVSLRGQIGAHARALNTLLSSDPAYRNVRERIGHHWTEVLGGVLVGSACAIFLQLVGS